MKKKTSLKVQIIVADYYKDISSSLTKSAISILKKNKINFDIIFVPGVYDKRKKIKWNIKKNKINLFIALGCVIKGQTYHFEVISDSVGKALLDLVNNNPNTLISNGIINAYKKKQALDRSKSNNKKVFEEFLDALIQEKVLIEVLSRGKTKSLTIGKLENKIARRLDFLYSPPHEYAFSTLYFTGSKAFNTVMRQHALNLNLTLNEHGFHKMEGKKKGEKIEGEFNSEEDC